MGCSTGRVHIMILSSKAAEHLKKEIVITKIQEEFYKINEMIRPSIKVGGFKRKLSSSINLDIKVSQILFFKMIENLMLNSPGHL